MSEMNILARMLIIIGVIIFLVGILFFILDKWPSFPIRVPGDILIKRENFVFYFPLGLCILISIVLTFLFRIFK